MALDYNSVNNAFKTVFARHATAAEWNVHAAYPSGQAVMDVLYDTDAYKEQTLPVARLYTAVLGRDPEPAGLAYYIVHMRDQGLRLDQAAFGFLHSPEAQSNFGYVTANDAEFIQALYLTCLGREGEQAGVDFYLDRLSHGTDRATVAIWFSYSPENQARVGDKHYAAFDVARFTETGSVLDGYLRGADVFADANGNGTWDEGEARTTTDAKGQWTLTDAEGPLIVTGGIDISTNLPNTTVLKATAGSTVVNPLTSLQQALVASGKTGAQAQAAVIEAFGLDANLDLGSYDPLAVLFDANATPQEKAVALQVQAAATKLQNLVVTASTTLTGVAGSTNLNAADASNAVMIAAARVLSSDADGVVGLGDTTFLQTVLTTSVATSGNAELASKAGIVSAMAGSFAAIMAEAATRVDTVLAGGGSDTLLTLAQIAQVQTAVQGTVAMQLRTAAAAGSLADTVGQLTGTALANLVQGADVGDLDPNSDDDRTVIGAVNSGGGMVPPPSGGGTPPPPPPEFGFSKSGANILTFSNAGATISVTESVGTYSFTTPGASGTGTTTQPIAGATIPPGATLSGSASVIQGLGAMAGAVALTDTTGPVPLADLVAVEGQVTGLVQATSVLAVSGTAADALLMLVTHEGEAGDKIDMNAAVGVHLSDTTATLADLTKIQAATTGLVDATSVTSASGTVADSKLLLITNEATTGDKIDMNAAVAVQLSDTTATLEDLRATQAATTGLVDATSVTSTSGTVDDALLLLVTNEGAVDDHIDMNAAVEVKLSDTTATLEDLKAIQAATTGLVDGTSVTSTSGTVDDALLLLVTNEGDVDDHIDMNAAVEVELSDTTATLEDPKAIQAATTGLVDATSVTSTSGTVDDALLLLVTNEGEVDDHIDMNAAVEVELSDTTATLEDLRNIQAATTGLVDATSVTSTSGTVDDALLLLVTNEGTFGDTIDMRFDVGVTLMGPAATATDFDAIADVTAGAVSGSIVLADSTFQNLATGDQLATGLEFTSNVLHLRDGQLQWLFFAGQLLLETIDNGTAFTLIQLDLVDVTGVHEAGGVFTIA